MKFFPKIVRPRILNLSTKIVFLSDSPQEYGWLYENLKEKFNGKIDTLSLYTDEFFQVTHELEWKDVSNFENSSLDWVLSKDDCWDRVRMDDSFSNLLCSVNLEVFPVIILWVPGLETRPTTDLYCHNGQADHLLKKFFESLWVVKPQELLTINDEDHLISGDYLKYSLDDSKDSISKRKKYGKVSCSDVLNQQPPINFFGSLYPYVVLNFRALYQYFVSLVYCATDGPRDSLSGTLGDSIILFNNELNINATALGLRKEIQKYYLGKYCTGNNRFNYTQFCHQLIGENLTLRLSNLPDPLQSIHISDESKRHAQILTLNYGMNYVKSYLDLNLFGFENVQRDIIIFETPVLIQFCIILDGNSHLDQISSHIRSIIQDFSGLGIPFNHNVRYVYLRDDSNFYHAYLASLENQSNVNWISLTRLKSSLLHLKNDGYYDGKLLVMIGLCPDFCWTSSETTVRVHPNILVSLYNITNQNWQTSLIFAISGALCGLTSSEIESFYKIVHDVHGQRWLNLLCDRLASLSRLRHNLVQLTQTHKNLMPLHPINSSEFFQTASNLVNELDTFELHFPSLNRTSHILSNIKALELLIQNANTSKIFEKTKIQSSIWIRMIPMAFVLFCLISFIFCLHKRRTKNAMHLKLP